MPCTGWATRAQHRDETSLKDPTRWARQRARFALGWGEEPVRILACVEGSPREVRLQRPSLWWLKDRRF